MYRIGLSGCSKPMNDATFAQYRLAGIDAAEISLAGEEYPLFDYKAAADAAKRHGVELWSFHLPFTFELYDISRADLAQNAVSALSEMIRRASDIGIARMVIHASGEPVPEDKEGRRERMERAKESLFRLAEVAKENGSTVAVEDLPRTCLGRNSDEILELIGAHPDLRVCFDTNHLLGENPVDFIRKMRGKIITTHVSDYDFINERHWLPGEGLIGWNELYLALKESGFNGVWMYELGFDAPKTLKRTRVLTFDDFSGNAHAIFNGEKPENFRVG